MDKELDIIYWNDLKIKLKKKYSTLTTADLQWRHGSIDDLLMPISFKLGKTKKELKDIIAKLETV
ncbi:MAG: hypothetical protein A2X13_06400 [Bacteroidetes bacterium GWC2_33_15]|nr:MAG: hypothetical protein A2X10_09970 [Bacteroidetes bacterium GWA2_33_15]OFX51593.1 MAG: hypothetical protein A2X13_06400 [Bacteroidetes bacterium GWC2_33_15]OFX63366.1 MAG: hypothetical protein A2X15_13965 [Bacteroidetes bacterium GWB2_32_14]OFX68063.1 MAG: hypothetical protein A2X14_08505 [Bacteroidetes bacterium GWD2_33_33]HAN17131.1 general stress protein CsbD [Bacteroidales bacterium]